MKRILTKAHFSTSNNAYHDQLISRVTSSLAQRRSIDDRIETTENERDLSPAGYSHCRARNRSTLHRQKHPPTRFSTVTYHLFIVCATSYPPARRLSRPFTVPDPSFRDFDNVAELCLREFGIHLGIPPRITYHRNVRSARRDTRERGGISDLIWL